MGRAEACPERLRGLQVWGYGGMGHTGQILLRLSVCQAQFSPSHLALLSSQGLSLILPFFCWIALDQEANLSTFL